MRVLVLGAGRMARGVVHWLVERDGDVRIRVVDRHLKVARDLARLWPGRRVTASVADLADRDAVRRLMAGADVTVSAAHYRYNRDLTADAIGSGSHLVDLGGNNRVVRQQLALSKRAARAGVTVIPDTGLAPGLVNLLAASAIEDMDRVESVRIRVGGVPLEPEGELGYQLVFSTEGLINEYVEDAIVLRDSRPVTVPSLTGLERIVFPKPFGPMEAFHTSGGASTLVETLAGRVDDLDYKTIRYPGHCERIRVLARLGFMGSRLVRTGKGDVVPRALTARLLEDSLPTGGADAVLLRVTAFGVLGHRPLTRRYGLVDRFDAATGLSAMARCTAFPTACIAWMLGGGRIDRPGVHCQEEIVPLAPFIAEMRGSGLDIRLRTGRLRPTS